MAGSEKSLRGRGGRVGGSQSISGRYSSTSSYPSTQNSTGSVSFPPLPVQYNHAPPPLNPNLPPPQAEDPPPPPQNQDQPMRIDDLLRIPGREQYLTVLDPLPRENTIWYEFCFIYIF